MEELDLKDLISMYWNRKIEILLFTLIGIFVGIFYSFFFKVPKYKSSTKLVMAQSSTSTEQTAGITQTDVTLNSKLVSTYSEIMKSKSVLKQVVENLNNEDITEKSIKNNLSVEEVDSTEVIQITVQNTNPEYAAMIANEIADVFSQKIVELYNISNIKLLDKAEISDTPSNMNHAKDIYISAFIGFAVGLAFVLFYNLLDTTIKNENDVESIDGLVVLALMPNYNSELKKNRGRKK